jgi:hypothetical protein
MTTPKSLGGMGFQDFVLFNQAMLGKHCLRLLIEPDSLCARVLKGRYFPETSFLSVVKPRSASYTWRSILFGWDLLVQGIRWNVGNGECIKIMQDNWIPDYPVGTFTTLEVLPEDAKVQFLLNDSTGGWDMDKLRFFFTDHMAETIQKIPISKHGGDDFASWPMARMGIYSVRSAYKLARTEKFFSKRCVKG